jgi:hypothetical protein
MLPPQFHNHLATDLANHNHQKPSNPSTNNINNQNEFHTLKNLLLNENQMNFNNNKNRFEQQQQHQQDDEATELILNNDLNENLNNLNDNLNDKENEKILRYRVFGILDRKSAGHLDYDEFNSIF